MFGANIVVNRITGLFKSDAALKIDAENYYKFLDKVVLGGTGLKEEAITLRVCSYNSLFIHILQA